MLQCLCLLPSFTIFWGSLSFSKIQVSNDMMFLCRRKNTTNVYNRGTETCTQLDASERHLGIKLKRKNKHERTVIL